MVKPLSEQFADLSAYAKKAEDSLAAARKDREEKVRAMREQSRAAASAAIDKIDRGMKSVGDAAARDWSDFQAKVSASVNALNARIEQKMHDLDVERAEDNALWLEEEAGFAIDYAIATIEEARLSVLDAIVARLDAEAAKSA